MSYHTPALTLAGALLMVACTPEPQVVRHTVDDYRADAALRASVVRDCRKDPGTLGETPDCVNALKAEALERKGGLREQGPVGLDPAQNPFNRTSR